jgi:hypothetical protein
MTLIHKKSRMLFPLQQTLPVYCALLAIFVVFTPCESMARHKIEKPLNYVKNWPKAFTKTVLYTAAATVNTVVFIYGCKNAHDYFTSACDKCLTKTLLLLIPGTVGLIPTVCYPLAVGLRSEPADHPEESDTSEKTEEEPCHYPTIEIVVTPPQEEMNENTYLLQSPCTSYNGYSGISSENQNKNR